jgi:hypothetical protein
VHRITVPVRVLPREGEEVSLTIADLKVGMVIRNKDDYDFKADRTILAIGKTRYLYETVDGEHTGTDTFIRQFREVQPFYEVGGEYAFNFGTEIYRIHSVWTGGHSAKWGALAILREESFILRLKDFKTMVRVDK